jgi:CBS domain-containing protein
MRTVRDILDSKKASTVWSIGMKDSVFDALKLMEEKGIGALMVKDDADSVVGIITERDYARKIVLRGRTAKETEIGEIMTPSTDMYRVKPESTVEDCMILITAKKIRHLPVFEGNRFAGLISIGDVVKSTISEQENLIEQLSNYIAGKYT